MIGHECITCQVNGWCEYDPFTDTVYPVDEKMCLVLKGE